MDAFNGENGRFRNFMSYDRRWLEESGSEDAHGRALWGLGVAMIFIMFSLWLMDKTIHGVIRRFRTRFRFEKLSDIASLPLVMIFMVVIQFAFQPITNSSSRVMERQADKFGMDISGVSGETAATAFDKLSVYNLSDPDPSELVEFWFYSHPALKKRIAFVRGYKP